ncbi:MAG: thioredoxin family protein [Candidatus Odinarchaeota archaeon]
MKIFKPEEFKDLFNEGKTFDEYVDAIEDKDHAKRYRLYYKRASIPDDILEKLSNLKYPLNVIVLAADWCWDCQTNVPIIIKLAEASNKINVRFFKKEEYPDLNWKTNGGDKVPMVHFFSEDGYYVTTWIEKPTITYMIYGRLRQKLGWDIDKYEFLKEYRQEFLRNQAELNEATAREILDVLLKVEAIFSTSPRLNHKV